MIPRLRTLVPVVLLVAASVVASSLNGASRRPVEVSAPAAPITIHAATLFNGRGGVIHDAYVTVSGDKIEKVDAGARARPSSVTYELGNATVMPGLIDAHVHPGWYINAEGALHNNRDNDTPGQSAMARAENLRATLAAGFTTIQSVGGPEDLELRDAVARGAIPGPRILTSIRQINDTSLSADSLRGFVRALKARGADVIKLFASSGLGAGGAQTFSDEKLAAICGEAKSLGLRSIVHAISAQSVRAATLAGCTQIEHGTFATQAELTLMAQHGTIFDPQVCLVFQNYLDNREVYTRSGFSESAFKALADAIPTATAMFAKAIATPGLKVVFGTDAVALAHGHNADELICRVRKGGQKPVDAIISATSAGANALGMGSRIGTLAPGFDADIIAVAGDPLTDITVMKKVTFVMRAGGVLK